MQIGIIGLGRMGMNMARRLQRDGHDVIAYNRSHDKTRALEAEGIKGAYSLHELVERSGKGKGERIVWIMLPAGDPVDEAINSLKGLLSRGDVVIEGGNSNYKDDLRRANELKPLGIEYADAGVSGGIWGLDNGYCIMMGGEERTYERLRPALDSLCAKDAHLYCGTHGAGHYVKMVHNGIEYAMMQAYGEGFELLERSAYGKGLDFAKVSNLWNRGSVVRSWLLELLADAFAKDARLESLSGFVEDSGEGRWMVKEGVDLGVAMPAITEALYRRFRSRQDESFAEKVLAALRREFGGHSVKTGGK